MSVITYFAVDRGKLISGHSEGVEYSFEIPFSGFDPDPTVTSQIERSYAGTKTTTRFNRIDLTGCSTSPVDDTSTLESMDEFLSSVEAGETFSIDLFGTIASPDNPVDYTLENGQYDKNRRGSTQYFTYEFRIEDA